MGISYQEHSKSFKLDSKDTSYIIGILDEEQFISHLYFGSYLPDENVNYLYGPRYQKRPSALAGERARVMDALPFEYSTQGIGDYREHCLEVETVLGHHACELHYVSHKIYAGKPKLEGLPATFDTDQSCTTLELFCKDSVLDLEIVLLYTTFENLDVITRSVQVKNNAEQPIYLKRVFSGCLDFPHQNFDILSLHGSWENECNPTRTPLTTGKYVIGNARGESSAQDSPFLALMSKNVTEDTGEVFAMNFVYSGNFYACAEAHHFGGTRAVMGIHPQNFTWKLHSGETFVSPEVIYVHSDEGFGKMTRTFHDLYRNHLIRSKYKDLERPILINNWEATYFDFNTEKLLAIAKEAKNCGIEMLVLDDGWFGKRDNDDKSLGDWFVNTEKLPGGLEYLSKEVNRLGMKFGLWFEPEMVSPDSELYRKHPDWAIQIPNRKPTQYRNQLVLDWSNAKVRDYIYDMMKEILSSANISYIKWDMNRILTDLGSVFLAPDCQQELCHRYVLGVYEVQERLTSDFPDLLIENCSAGGSRFDAGMLYYSPQIWASDNSDAIERLHIQYGTSLCYPLSTMGAHISAVPNHQTGRVIPMETRGYVSLAGTFGYELDITKIPEEDRKMIPAQTKMCHKYNKLVREGDLYRISDIFGNPEYACWAVVSKDKSEALVTYIQIHTKRGYWNGERLIQLKGLDENSIYQIEGTDFSASGAALMYGGYWMDMPAGDYLGRLIHLIRK